MDDYLIEELANYNTRVSDGIVHTQKYKKRMKKLQKQFDEELK
mgnify:FL=1